MIVGALIVLGLLGIAAVLVAWEWTLRGLNDLEHRVADLEARAADLKARLDRLRDRQTTPHGAAPGGDAT